MYISIFNVRGLIPQTNRSKVPAIREYLHETSQLFICLSETWLSTNHTDAEKHIAGYTAFSTDRKLRGNKRGRHSGGVAVYIRDDLAALSHETFRFSNGVIESIAVYIKNLNLVVINV